MAIFKSFYEDKEFKDETVSLNLLSDNESKNKSKTEKVGFIR